MTGALNTIGLIADVFGLGTLADNAFEPQPVSGTQVNVTLGFGDGRDGVTGFDGTLDSAYAFDYANNFLDQGSTADAGTGGAVVHITVDQQDPDRQGRSVGLSAGEDDVCVVLITVNQHDGGYTGTWNDDVGYNCGKGWYLGGDIEGMINGADWRPRCMWMGAPGDHGESVAAIKFNTIAYSSEGLQTIDNGDDICGATIFDSTGGVISGRPGGANPQSSKKRLASSLPLPAIRKDWMEQTLIVSNHTSQTAEQLCSHGMSHGPDFVDSNGNYCDMKTKTPSPVCAGSNSIGCVTLSDDSKTVTKRSSVARRTVDAVHKTYTAVQRWGPK